MSYAHLLHTAHELIAQGLTPNEIYPTIVKGHLVEAITPLANAMKVKISEVNDTTIEIKCRRNSKYNSTVAGITISGLANHPYGATTMTHTPTKSTLCFDFPNKDEAQ